MPVRVTAARRGRRRPCGHGPLRRGPVRRCASGSSGSLTDHAWTEDPPSRTRHFVTNVRTFAAADGDDLRVESALLLFRSRGDRASPTCSRRGRRDLLRGGPPDGLRLARREITVDESVLRTQNLAVFL